MPSILNDEEKEIVRRQVPKANNKIQAIAAARLYIAYPDRSKWTNTGYQGVVVLANDLVGNTYWLKLVDVSPLNRGIIWDQEIYDTWNYNQDRTFFHTFEIEECLAGLSFVDEKEAKTFLKKMNNREKNASKATKAKLFGGITVQGGGSGFRHGLHGGFFGGQRQSSAQSTQPTPPESPSFSLSPTHKNKNPESRKIKDNSDFAALYAIDPNWRENWGDDLKSLGITDDLIRENQDFIADYIKAPKEPIQPLVNANENGNQRIRSPPPPQNLAASSASGRGRGTPPAPPPARRSAVKVELHREPTPPRDSSPLNNSLPQRFAAPPPLPEAGKLAHIPNQQMSKVQIPAQYNPGPRPPPRPPKNPKENSESAVTKFSVPPLISGERNTGPSISHRSGPSIPPRGALPPLSRVSNTSAPQYIHPPIISDKLSPPPLPPKIPTASGAVPPPLPPSSWRPTPRTIVRESENLNRESKNQHPPSLSASQLQSNPPVSRAPSPPALPFPQTPSPQPTQIPKASPLPPPPPPPPFPISQAPPAPLIPSSQEASPPKSVPVTHTIPIPPPPPPPLPPPVFPITAASQELHKKESGHETRIPSSPENTGDRSNLLAGIQKAGGIGCLKKVDPSKIRDRSQAIVPGSSENKSSGTEGANLGADGGLAGALAAALNKRKKKVSTSDDEAEDDD
ncbi:hypothetical protein EPUL_002103, partial [Erysiphe pulchra]